MMSLTFGLFTQVSGLGPLGPLVNQLKEKRKYVAGPGIKPGTTGS